MRTNSIYKKTQVRIISALVTVLLILPFVLSVSAGNYGFSDVSPTPWAYRDIIELAEKGIINGFPDGTYRPGDPVTRAQFAKLVVGVFKEPIEKREVFSDVSTSSWANIWVTAAIDLGIIIPDEYGEILGANNPITREEATLWMVRAIGVECIDSELNFIDSDRIIYKAEVATAVEIGLIFGMPGDLFAPTGIATRAQAAVLITRMMLINNSLHNEINDDNGIINIAYIAITDLGYENQLLRLAVLDFVAKYQNVNIKIRDSEFNIPTQISMIEEAIAQRYDAIIIEAISPSALNGAVKKAEESGISVISINASNPTCLHTLHMKKDDYLAGWESGRMLAEIVSGKGTAVLLDCPSFFKSSERMGTGFESYITQNTNIALIEKIPIENWTTNNAFLAMLKLLSNYRPGEITMVYCASSDIAIGAVNAINFAERQDEGILVWGFGGYPIELESIKTGGITGTMWLDLYAQYSEALNQAMYHIENGISAYSAGYAETPVLIQPMLPVTIDNVDEIMVLSRLYE